MSTRVLRLWIARCMLVAFALALGAAAASPWVAPRAMQLVCTDGAVKLVALDDDDGAAGAPSGHTLECALCLVTGTPPLDLQAHVAQRVAVAQVPRWAHGDAPQLAETWAPLLARGPPVGRA